MRQVLCNSRWIASKLNFRPFHEALHDFNLVFQKDVDVRLIESILLSSRFLPDNPHMLPVELLSRFSRAPGANSPAIGRMVVEAAVMVLVTSERCVVPFYPCVSPSSSRVGRNTQYGPTHVLAVTTIKLHKYGQDEEEEEEEQEEEEQNEEKQGKEKDGENEEEENKGQEGEEEEEEEEEEEQQETKEQKVEDFDYSAIVAVVWSEHCGLQIWRTGPDHCTFQPFYHVSDQVRCCLVYCD